jgi:WD40 repeat protein
VSLRDGRVLAEYAASVEAFSLATSRRHLLTAGIEGTISLFDFESGRPMQRVQAAHAGRMKRVLCTPDGLVVSSGADALVKIWRLESGRGLRFVHALTDHMDSVTEMTLTADGRVCTASRDGVVRFFERKDDQLTLLGTLHNLRDGFLWTTPNSTKEKGCFWTDRPDLIQVSARQGSERQVLAKGDTRRSEFIAIHNSDIVMMQIRDARAYEARLSLRSDRVEIERRLRTHRLSKRLPGSPHREARS